MIPPARCTSSMWYCCGRQLHNCGTRRAQRIDVAHREIHAGPRARRRADAGWCWSSRPLRCPAPSRSGRPRRWRCRAATRWRRRRRTSDGAQLDRGTPALEQRRRDPRGWRKAGAVARQRQAQRLGQAVHRVGGEHAAAGAAGRAGAALDRGDLLVVASRIGGQHHRIDQVELVRRKPWSCRLPSARRRRTPRRDVEAQRGHQHPGRDLVAVGDAHQRIGAVGVRHVFHRSAISSRGQRVQHAVVAHRDAVVHRDGVELWRRRRRLDLARHQLPEVLQVHVPGTELGERVGDRDDRRGIVVACRWPATARAPAMLRPWVRGRLNGTRASWFSLRGGKEPLDALILLAFHGFSLNRRSCEIGMTAAGQCASVVVISPHVALPHIAGAHPDHIVRGPSSYSSLLPATRCGTIRRVTPGQES